MCLDLRKSSDTFIFLILPVKIFLFDSNIQIHGLCQYFDLLTRTHSYERTYPNIFDGFESFFSGLFVKFGAVRASTLLSIVT